MPDLSNSDLEATAHEMIKNKILKEEIKFQDIKLVKEKTKTSMFSIDGMNFLVEKCKIQGKTKSKIWTTCKSHNDFPKKGSFSSYFDWVTKNCYMCSKHTNCNLNTLSKILPIKGVKSKPICVIKENYISSELWLCNNFPLPLRTIFPLFDIIACTNPILAKFNDFLKVTQLVNSSSFPLRMAFPISQTAFIKVQFSNASLRYILL